jgi:prepilin-type N-terminal cleavage/methylation domain-containing protein
MPDTQRGFSLTEALISLLVLSIGWLGLGQLQARLSSAGISQSGSAYGHMILSDFHEKTVSYELSGILDSPPDSDPVTTPSVTYTLELSRAKTGTRSDTTIEVEWTDIDIARNEKITLTTSTYPDPHDTRWLLISP